MASGLNKNVRKKPIGEMLFMGILSVALYAVLLMKQDAINSYFGRGGYMHSFRL